MSAEPLTREERHNCGMTAYLYDPTCRECRYEATVQAVEAKLADCERRALTAAVERAEALRAALERLRDEWIQCENGPQCAAFECKLIRAALAADDEARAT